MITILISMVSAGIITAVSEEVLTSLGKSEYSKWIKAGGISLTAGLGLGLVVKLIKQAKDAFGG